MILAACGGSSSKDKPAPQPETPQPATPKPGTPPARPKVITSLEPNNIVGLQSDQKPDKWVLSSKNMYTAEDGAKTLYYGTQEITLGHMSYQLALWEFADANDSIDGALLEIGEGSYRPLWVKRPLMENGAGAAELADASVGDVVLEVQVKIGPDRIAMLHTPGIIGCGAEDCKPEDDFVPSQLVEIAADGASLVWRLDVGPRCTLDPIDPHAKDPQCSLATAPGAVADHFDLIVTIVNGKKKVVTRYAFKDGKYQAVTK
jgi:hypothetical protein